MYCEYCKVEVEGAARFCPLCHRTLDGEKAMFPVVRKSKRLSHATFTAVYLIIALVIAVVCLTINLVFPFKLLWSMPVLGSMIYLYVLIGWTLFSQKHIATKIFLQTIALAVLFGFLQQLSPEVRWAANYAIPAVMLVGGILLAIIAFAAKKAGSYIFNLLLVAVTGVIPLVYNFIVAETIWWPSVVCTAVCGLLFVIHIITSAVYGKSIIKEEIKRKFHM